MKIKKRIKKKVVFHELNIILYWVDRGELTKQRNIEAFDRNNKLVWVVEKPTKDIYYFDIQIDYDYEFLEADSGAGEKYEINIKNGKIIRSRLYK